MAKITFLGAGSTVFVKAVLGDVMTNPILCESEIALFDIDPVRLADSEKLLKAINENCNEGRASIKAYTDRKEALKGAGYVVCAVQIGGYDPCTITDFEVPKKYGLRQTIGDTIGIGGIFRALRTIPVFMDFARDMEEVCPDAYFLNYTNPMAMITGALQRNSSIKTIGLCHSVQVCTDSLLDTLGMSKEGITSKIAGINHMAWLLEIKRNQVDIYPEIKERAKDVTPDHKNLVRIKIMQEFGYYITESSEHLSEYLPYFIKDKYPELIEKYNIPLDEYPRRCVRLIKNWETQRKELVENKKITHESSNEYASRIIEAIETNKPYKIGGNVLNTGLIENLPKKACVEVPCLVDASGISPCYVGELPEQLAALNRTNINVQLLTIEAAMRQRKEHIYHAAMLDPHTSSELSIDDIRALCDDLIEAHGDWLPKYK